MGNILEYIGNYITESETNSKRFMLSGSNGEGVVISNDVDYMLVEMQFEVTEHQRSRNRSRYSLTALSDEHTHAGFATLLVNNTDVFPYKECIEMVDGKPCLGSALYVQKALKQVTEVSDAEGYHGPAVIRSGASDLHVPSDYVFTLACPAWPARVRQRFKERNQKWPREDLLSQLERSGCHFVPIGFPRSPNKNAEWRLSFSAAEKVLVKSLNLTQYHCFNFLKLMGRGRLQCNSEPKVLCTYYLKTALFWTIEEEPEEIWVENQFLTCLTMILSRVVSFLRNHSLPNYFLPENNMIDHIPYERCCEVSEELQSIQTELLYHVFCIVSLGFPVEEEGRVFAEQLSLVDKETNFASEKDREIFNRELVKTLNSLESTELKEVMQRAINLIDSDSEIFRHKHRKDVRNDLQNFLDPVLFDFYPGVHRFDVAKQALKSAIENIDSLTERPSYASCYKKVLYRALGNLCHVQAFTGRDSQEKAKLNKEAEYYYSEGIMLVFPDGFNDHELSGHVHLAQFHYLNGDYEKTADEIRKTESVIQDENLAQRISAYCVCTEICTPLHLEVLQHDKALHRHFSQLQPRASKFINSVAFAHFLRIRTFMRAGGQLQRDEDSSTTLASKFRTFCEYISKERSFAFIDKIVKESTELLLQSVVQI